MKNYFCIAICLLAGPIVSLANAQEAATPEQEMQVILAATESMKVDARKKFEARFGIRINEMKEACVLSNAQVKKLKIAARGAAIKATEEVQKQMRQMMENEGLGMPEEIAPKNAQGVEVIIEGGGIVKIDGGGNVVADDQFAAQMRMDGFGFEEMFGDSIQAEDIKIWKLTVSKTLTKEQQKKYDAVIVERRKFKRMAAAQEFVALADGKLLLSADQRVQLESLLSKDLSRSFDDALGDLEGEGELEDSPIRKILTEAQFKALASGSVGAWK